jgi:hypothetical protein
VAERDRDAAGDGDRDQDEGTSNPEAGHASCRIQWDSDELANAEPYPDANLHIIQDAEQNAHTHSDVPAGTSSRYRHPCAAWANQHGRPDGHGYSPDPHGDPERNRYFHCRSHRHPDYHGHGRFNRHAGLDGDRHTDADGYTDVDADRHANVNRYTDIDTDGHTHIDADRYSDVNADRHADSNRYGDIDAY